MNVSTCSLGVSYPFRAPGEKELIDPRTSYPGWQWQANAKADKWFWLGFCLNDSALERSHPELWVMRGIFQRAIGSV
jgi:hypothetical protein